MLYMSFLLMAKLYSIVWVYHILFIHQSRGDISFFLSASFTIMVVDISDFSLISWYVNFQTYRKV